MTVVACDIGLWMLKKVNQIRFHPLTSSIRIVVRDLQCNLFGE
jgi:hypothetical protein